MYRPRSHDLSGANWRVGYLKGYQDERAANIHEVASITRWFPARVPGNVRDDLMRNGLLPDLYFGQACEDHHWVNDCFWWYERAVTIKPEPRQRVFVDLRGVDYRSVVFWNRTRLGSNEGMFSRQLYEVTSLIERDNMLRVRIAGSKYLPTPELTRFDRYLQPLATKLQGMEAYPDRFGTLKCQMSYGWDFAPELRTMGVWDDVLLHVSGSVFIERAALSATIAEDGHTAELRVRAALNAAAAGKYRLSVTVEGDTCDARPQHFDFSVYLPEGREVVERSCTVRDPQRWYTWDRGAQALYRVRIRVLSADEELDELHERFGFRDIRMQRNPETPRGVPDWTFAVNGDPVFVRGANWVPADCLPGRLRRSDYAELIRLAREANINMLRVWGGGLREKAAFYDLCAEQGIMVWQEFPLACAFLDRFPRSARFLTLLEKEVGAIVKAVHNEPAVVVYCGGNEFSPSRNEPVVEVIRRIVTALDPQRPFFEASPRPGDVHNWAVWHNFANLRAYAEGKPQFFSEFGLQALPAEESVRQFLPEEALWPPNAQWETHGAQVEKLERYAKPMGEYNDLAGMIASSQRAQALGLQIAIEHARRRKYACSGVMFWQFNEPWPAISWSVLDYFRRPKLAYRAVQRSYSPLLVSVKYPLRSYRPGDKAPIQVWVINDTMESFAEAHVEVFMLGEEGRVFSMGVTVEEVPPDSVGQVLRFDLVLPNRPDWTLHATLSAEGRKLSENEYDLRLCDRGEATTKNRLMYRVTNRLFE